MSLSPPLWPWLPSTRCVSGLRPRPCPPPALSARPAASTGADTSVQPGLPATTVRLTPRPEVHGLPQLSQLRNQSSTFWGGLHPQPPRPSLQGPPFLLSGSARRCPGLESPCIAPPSLHPPQPPARASRPSLLQGGPGSRCPRTPAQARLSPAVIKVLPGQPAPVTAAGREIPSRHCETQASVAFRDKSKSP